MSDDPILCPHCGVDLTVEGWGCRVIMTKVVPSSLFRIPEGTTCATPGEVGIVADEMGGGVTTEWDEVLCNHCHNDVGGIINDTTQW